MLTMYKVPVSAQRAEIDVDVALPSSDIYAALVQEGVDFSVRMHVSILYRLSYAKLSSLVEKDGVRETTLADWHRQLQASLQQESTKVALDLGGAAGPGAQTDIDRLSNAVSEALSNRFPAIQVISVSTAVRHLPDAALYARLKAAYLHAVDQKGAAFAALAPRMAAEEAAQKAALARHETSMDLLQRYGELLDKHPALIKLLFLANAGKLSPKDLMNLDILDKLSVLE
jgi:hypothetical protein